MDSPKSKSDLLVSILEKIQNASVVDAEYFIQTSINILKKFKLKQTSENLRLVVDLLVLMERNHDQAWSEKIIGPQPSTDQPFTIKD